MYGLILQGVQEYIVKKFGAKVWQEVLYVSGVDENNFSVRVLLLKSMTLRASCTDYTAVP